MLRCENDMNASRAVVMAPGRREDGVLLLCDHASNRIPAEFGRLGLPEGELERHIAWDIGAAGVRLLA